MNVLTRGVRNAGRNAVRAFAIVIILGISLGLSLVMLTASRTINGQIDQTLSAIGTTVKIAPNGVLAGEGGAHLSMGEVQKVSQISHVTQLSMATTVRLQTVGTTSDIGGGPGDPMAKLTSLLSARTLPAGQNLPSNFSSSISLTGTNNPTDSSVAGLDSIRLTSGTTFDGGQDNHKALISSALALKNNLRPGASFTAAGQTFTVAGVFAVDTEKGSDLVLISLPTAQAIAGTTDNISAATVTVDSLRNLAAATADIRQTLHGQPADVSSGVEEADNALKPLAGVQRVAAYSVAGAITASAVIILLTMIMIVRERRREIGILKAIGLGHGRIVVQYMCEALTFALLSVVIGLLIGLAASGSVTSALVSNAGNPTQTGDKGVDAIRDTIAGGLAGAPAQIGWDVIAIGIGVAVVLALAGSALAAFTISKIKPADVLRSE